MQIAAIQLPVRMDVAANLHDLHAAIAALPPHTLAVAPEGCLSGYRPAPGFVRELDEAITANAIEATRQKVVAADIHLVVGACVRNAGAWFNASFYMGPKSELWRYDKINLARSERDDLTAGDRLPVLDIVVDQQPVRIGVQMCREIRYPEQWRHLAVQGAQIIAYVNNAVGNPDGPDLWRAHVISRAAETQRFVVGANNAAFDQGCPSLLVAPSGKVLAEASVGLTSVVRASIDLSEVSDWVLSQARDDVVSVRGC